MKEDSRQPPDAVSAKATEDAPEEDRLHIPEEIPVLPLRDVVVFPGQAAPLQVGRPESLKLVEAVMATPAKILGLFTHRDAEESQPGPEDLHPMGTAAVILKLLKYPEGNVMILIKGLERLRAGEFLGDGPFLRARVEEASTEDYDPEDLRLQAQRKALKGQMEEMFGLMPFVPEELKLTLLNVEDPGQLADLLVAYMDVKTEDKQKILETLDISKRLDAVIHMVRRETELLLIGSKIQKDVRSSMDERMREQYLREQMKAIQKELGEGEEDSEEVRDFHEQIVKAEMPEKAEEEALKELDRLSNMHPSSAEYTVVRTYLDWLVELPWNRLSEDKLDIPAARTILEEDHYDLQEAKDRILEYLAVQKLNPDRKGPILCFVGPPGTGKTSLGKSIARAMGRCYHRMSLGGMRDEAEIRGHRRTYVGAMPGRIIQALRKCGTRNPVFVLDEVDKIGMDFRGDPASALLEVLDPEQNNAFVDLYLAMPFDLSRVMFVTTANTLETIPSPLRDRMEVINVSGYTLEEKVIIAQRYLIPRQREEHGLDEEKIGIEEEALRKIINGYTREAGLRNLEREIGKACRKSALRITEEGATGVHVTAENLHEILGPQKFFPETAERTETPGVAVGLAWTPTGGDILFIEATRMPGKGQLILTGSLGDVMKESASAALSYLRSNAGRLALPETFHSDSDIHVHVPAGAIPKDGPSAGITIATALASLLLERPCRNEMAMTGEITLRGKVMPVGGIKEKVLAAKRAGIQEILLPEHNRKDIQEIEDSLLEGLEFRYVKTLDQVFDFALEPKKKKKKGEKSGAGAAE